MAGTVARSAGSDGGGGAMTTAGPLLPREALLTKALWLEYLTVGWNVIEGVIAVIAAIASGSVAQSCSTWPGLPRTR